MEYREFGKTGMKLSRLGFGAMRLPMKDVDGKSVVDEDKAIPAIHRAFELGVNYIDTAWMYCNELSEVTVGKAVNAWGRDKIHVSSKYPFNGPFREILEKQLSKLGMDYLDVYHLHGIGSWFIGDGRREDVVAQAMKAKEEGLIRNFSFSFHDKPEAMIQLVDTGLFASVLCQYNLLDRGNEEAMAYAKEKGLGVIVMGPVGGGRIAGMSPEIAAKFGVEIKTNAELALRFVLSNPNVDMALSGMSSMEMVEENTAIASNTAPLSEAEKTGIERTLEDCRKLAQLYCTGCNYCLPHCPQEVNISRIFEAMNNHRVYGMTSVAKGMYNEIGERSWAKGKKADACIECGACEEHCPQKIEIRKQLKECHAELV